MRNLVATPIFALSSGYILASRITLVQIIIVCDNICDQIWENPPYGIRARFAHSAFLVAQVQICHSPDFVIYMSNNPSNCCCLLWRLVVLYEGEISLHFDPPSRHSHRTRSPLLWAVKLDLYVHFEWLRPGPFN